MSDLTESERFSTLFAAVHERFQPRVAPGSYRPSPESLAVLHHLATAGPLTIGEAAAHFRRSQAASATITMPVSIRRRWMSCCSTSPS